MSIKILQSSGDADHLAGIEPGMVAASPYPAAPAEVSGTSESASITYKTNTAPRYTICHVPAACD